MTPELYRINKLVTEYGENCIHAVAVGIIPTKEMQESEEALRTAIEALVQENAYCVQQYHDMQVELESLKLAMKDQL